MKLTGMGREGTWPLSFKRLLSPIANTLPPSNLLNCTSDSAFITPTHPPFPIRPASLEAKQRCRVQPARPPAHLTRQPHRSPSC